MRVLIACEMSGIVRDEFAALGHDVWSCDLLPTERPGDHYQGDVRDILDGWQPVRFQAECDPDGDGWCQIRECDTGDCPCLGPTQDGVEYKEVNGVLLGRHAEHLHWDLMIAHPPCDYLTVSNNGPMNHGCSLYTAEQAQQLRSDAIDFFMLLANAPIERIAIENPVGIMSSRHRKPDQIIQPWHFGDDASKKTCLWLNGLPRLVPTNQLPGDDTTRRANQTPNGQNKLGPSPDRKKLRSMTYPGIAKAMAEQWGIETKEWLFQ